MINKVTISIVLIIVIIGLTSCGNESRKVEPIEPELIISNEEVKFSGVNDTELIVINELIEVNITQKMDSIDKLLNDFAENQELITIVFNRIDDYESMFDMIEEQERIIGSSVDGVIVNNRDVINIVFINEEDVVYEFMNSTIRYSNLEIEDVAGYETYSYINPNDIGEIYFLRKLKNILTGENAYVIIVVRNTFLTSEITQIINDESTNLVVDIRDGESRSVYLNEVEIFEEAAIKSVNKYGWEFIASKRDE